MTNLIIVAPAGPTREGLVAFFSERVDRCHVLAREAAVADQALVIEDEQVRWRGEDVLTGTRAAVILDSSYMWPVPALMPTTEQWAAYEGQFDLYLRDERESRSFWISLMEILTDRLDYCVNPQEAFVHAALRPAALARLAAAGVPVPPQIDTNDPDAAQAFAAAHPGHLLSLPLGGRTDEPVWIAPEAVAELRLTEGPVSLQSVASQELRRGQAIGRSLVSGNESLLEDRDLAGVVSTLMETLSLEWAELTFRLLPSGWALSDFSPAPRLEALDAAAQERVLEALWQRLQERR
jgi:hypothetical protein